MWKVIGARLESVYTIKGIVGSNPTLSAINLTFYKLFYLFLLNNLLEDLEIYKKMIKYRDYFREYRKLKREILNSVNRVFESGM